MANDAPEQVIINYFRCSMLKLPVFQYDIFSSNVVHSIASVCTPATLHSADPTPGSVTSAGIRQSTPIQSAAMSTVAKHTNKDATIIVSGRGNAI